MCYALNEYHGCRDTSELSLGDCRASKLSAAAIRVASLAECIRLKFSMMLGPVTGAELVTLRAPLLVRKTLLRLDLLRPGARLWSKVDPRTSTPDLLYSEILKYDKLDQGFSISTQSVAGLRSNGYTFLDVREI